ncbi:MAG TPA: ATP-binding protein [Thermoanaerobaculia bacterium]|nr:ATP-binding protein [Thermoanaerobaculia bacterium]
MTLRFLQCLGGRLAVLALVAGAAGFPPAALAQTDDGLSIPRMRAFRDERDDAVEERDAAPEADSSHRLQERQRRYQIMGLSDGEQEEIYLRAPDSDGLRLQTDGTEPLPPVSADDGTFHFQVDEARETPPPRRVRRHRPAPTETRTRNLVKEAPPRLRPRAVLTGLHVEAATSILQNRDRLTFSFKAIDPAARFLRFHYRLAGVDPDWTDTAQRSARYPMPQPGPYRFEVKAINDAGLWSEPAGLSFTVLPLPWWRRHPYLIAGLAAAGIAVLISLYTIIRARRLLQMERLRASIAADLHDQVGAGLTDIAILSEVAARKAGDLPELARVAATARELVDGMGDIVWLINPRWDSLHELFLRLKDSYAELFAHGGAELEVGDLSVFEGVHLPMAWRQDLHLLFKEAIRNALRHSGCRRAELSVALRGRRLEVLLQDDGRGFSPERQNGHGEGLEIMRRRAERLGGLLTIDSSPQGTLVRFAGTIP